jgi:alpha-1,3-mannosylglycoprotein beta-1,4-N-acetylglucosaminyltransferase A/B
MFGKHIERGVLEVISPPADFYPNLTALRPTLGDEPERVQWRSKQNLDYAFLMMYAQWRGIYYVQLEDDILTKPSFVTTM